MMEVDWNQWREERMEQNQSLLMRKCREKNMTFSQIGSDTI
jgi:hypothetical protein